MDDEEKSVKPMGSRLHRSEGQKECQNVHPVISPKVTARIRTGQEAGQEAGRTKDCRAGRLLARMDDYSSKNWGEDFLQYTILRASTRLVNTRCLVADNPLFSRQRAPLEPQQITTTITTRR
jgi:hypothetical protein